MGGPALEGIKTLTASGRTKRVRGNNLVPIEFELGIELPDKYFRKDEFPAEETDPTSLGFNGDSLVQTPAPVAGPPPGARPGGPPPPTPAQIEAQRKTRVNGVKQDFVRFALGMFAASFETYPLTFAFAAQARHRRRLPHHHRARPPSSGRPAFWLRPERRWAGRHSRG